MKIAIVDYGAGNLRSVAKAFEKAAEGSAIMDVTADPDRIAKADRIVLPGVGAFAECKHGLDSRPGLIEAMKEAVLSHGRPFLGICVGMQLLASEGVEFGATPGLDWIAGSVLKMKADEKGLRIPHMGWNELEIRAPKHPLFQGIKNGDHVYFVHSFAFEAEDPATILAETDYGGKVAAAIGKDNMVGVQFHPEKSQEIGLRLIDNFIQWRP